MPGRHAKTSPVPTAIVKKAAAILPGVLAASAAAGVATAAGGDAATVHQVSGGRTQAIAHPLAPVAKKAPIRVKDPLYTVRKGDSLSSIAQRLCHKAADWTGLYKRNHHLVGADPNLIIPGQALAVVCRQAVIAQAAPAHTATAPVRATLDGDGDGDHDSSDASPQPSTQQAPPAASVTGVVTTAGLSGFEQCVIQAESGGDPTAINPSSGASGLFGFLLSTWDALGLGYPGGASTAPPSVQMRGFAIEYARAGTAPWAPYDGC